MPVPTLAVGMFVPSFAPTVNVKAEPSGLIGGALQGAAPPQLVVPVMLLNEIDVPPVRPLAPSTAYVPPPGDPPLAS